MTLYTTIEILTKISHLFTSKNKFIVIKLLNQQECIISELGLNIYEHLPAQLNLVFFEDFLGTSFPHDICV
jgi:hypothetical protein